MSTIDSTLKDERRSKYVQFFLVTDLNTATNHMKKENLSFLNPITKYQKMFTSKSLAQLEKITSQKHMKRYKQVFANSRKIFHEKCIRKRINKVHFYGLWEFIQIFHMTVYDGCKKWRDAIFSHSLDKIRFPNLMDDLFSFEHI